MLLVQIYNGLRNAVQDALFLFFALSQHVFCMFALGAPFFLYLKDVPEQTGRGMIHQSDMAWLGC